MSLNDPLPDPPLKGEGAMEPHQPERETL